MVSEMRLVRTLNEIEANMDTLDRYLLNKTESTYSYALGLVKRGTCFIVKRNDSGYCFYPSRFIGYANNTMDQHLNNDMKDGKETNPVITQILGSHVRVNPVLDKEYRLYCEKLGFIANEKGAFGVERKFWEL